MPTRQEGNLAKNGSICARRSDHQDNDLTGRIDTVNLKNTLGQVEADRGNLHDGWLPFCS